MKVENKIFIAMVACLVASTWISIATIPKEFKDNVWEQVGVHGDQLNHCLDSIENINKRIEYIEKLVEVVVIQKALEYEEGRDYDLQNQM